MKTIEEIRNKEYICNMFCQKQDYCDICILMEIYEMGATRAQAWIDVMTKRPTPDDGDILVRGVNYLNKEVVNTARVKDNGSIETNSTLIMKRITHWRPVELNIENI